MVRKMETREALIACALFCDSMLGQIDGDPRDFCVVSKRRGAKFAQFTSNLANGGRLDAAEMLLNTAGRLIDAHERERRTG
jgi:hypothetical protein